MLVPASGKAGCHAQRKVDLAPPLHVKLTKPAVRSRAKLVHPHLDYPHLDYPQLDYPHLDLPQLDLDYPQLDYPHLDYPQLD